MSRNAGLQFRKDMDWNEGKVGWIIEQIELYRESPMRQGLAVASRSSTSLPVVGSGSRVRLLNVGCDRILMH